MAARDRPDTSATGTARISGHGVATTSTATARMGSPLQAQAAPASATVAARNTMAYRSARRDIGARERWAAATRRTIPAYVLSAARRAATRWKASPALVDPLRTGSPTFRRTGMDSPVSADWSSTAVPSTTAPSTGTTSPLRITRRSPGSIASSETSSSPPFRCLRAVRGTRASSADISRLARRSAKLSRYCPPEYITATTAAARYSANRRAASMESAATTSRPTSPRRKPTTISITRTTRTGAVAAAHTGPAQCSHPKKCAASPKTSPAAGHTTRTGRRNVRTSVRDRSLRAGRGNTRSSAIRYGAWIDLR